MNETRNTKLWAAFAATALLAATGCQSTGTSPQTSLQTEPQQTAQTLPAPAEPEAAVVEEQPAPAPPELATVYFGYDSWRLRDEARSTLRSNAKLLQASPDGGVLTVAGHCDERGSEEYNIALGDRRAAAVKRYLMDLGVPSERLRTVSFGESRPAVRGEGEAAWSRNRRAEFSLGTRQASRQ